MKPFVVIDVVDRSTCQKWCLGMVCMSKRLPTVSYGSWLELLEAGMQGECEAKKRKSETVKESGKDKALQKTGYRNN